MPLAILQESQSQGNGLSQVGSVPDTGVLRGRQVDKSVGQVHLTGGLLISHPNREFPDDLIQWIQQRAQLKDASFQLGREECLSLPRAGQPPHWPAGCTPKKGALDQMFVRSESP